MRTIRFRGQRLSDGKWIYGSLVQFLDGSVGICNGDDFDHYKIYAVKKSTIGQFTDLTDKDGKPIYKGDIVRHPYIDPIFGDLVTTVKKEDWPVSRVDYNEGAFTIQYNDIHYYLGEFTRNNHVEVIGNVIDNPEMKIEE